MATMSSEERVAAARQGPSGGERAGAGGRDGPTRTVPAGDGAAPAGIDATPAGVAAATVTRGSPFDTVLPLDGADAGRPGASAVEGGGSAAAAPVPDEEHADADTEAGAVDGETAGNGEEHGLEGADEATKAAAKAVFWAARDGKADKLAALLAEGASHSAHTDGRNWTPLGWAAENGALECVQLLLEAGADPGARFRGLQQTPLHAAARWGHAAIVRLMLRSGADPNMVDSHGNSALHLACHTGHSPTVRALVDEGADLDLQSITGDTALHHACMQNHRFCAVALLNAGADPTLQKADGRTPLHIAALWGYTFLVRKLCEAGADVTVRTNAGKTAADLAGLNKRSDTLDVIKEWKQAAEAAAAAAEHGAMGGAGGAPVLRARAMSLPSFAFRRGAQGLRRPFRFGGLGARGDRGAASGAGAGGISAARQAAIRRVLRSGLPCLVMHPKLGVPKARLVRLGTTDRTLLVLKKPFFMRGPRPDPLFEPLALTDSDTVEVEDDGEAAVAAMYASSRPGGARPSSHVPPVAPTSRGAYAEGGASGASGDAKRARAGSLTRTAAGMGIEDVGAVDDVPGPTGGGGGGGDATGDAPSGRRRLGRRIWGSFSSLRRPRAASSGALGSSGADGSGGELAASMSMYGVVPTHEGGAGASGSGSRSSRGTCSECGAAPGDCACEADHARNASSRLRVVAGEVVLLIGPIDSSAVAAVSAGEAGRASAAAASAVAGAPRAPTVLDAALMSVEVADVAAFVREAIAVDFPLFPAKCAVDDAVAAWAEYNQLAAAAERGTPGGGEGRPEGEAEAPAAAAASSAADAGAASLGSGPADSSRAGPHKVATRALRGASPRHAPLRMLRPAALVVAAGDGTGGGASASPAGSRVSSPADEVRVARRMAQAESERAAARLGDNERALRSSIAQFETKASECTAAREFESAVSWRERAESSRLLLAKVAQYRETLAHVQRWRESPMRAGSAVPRASPPALVASAETAAGGGKVPEEGEEGDEAADGVMVAVSASVGASATSAVAVLGTGVAGGGVEDEEDYDELCIVCLERRRNAVLQPCEHRGTCVQCAEQLAASSERFGGRCPLCRCPIDAIVPHVE